MSAEKWNIDFLGYEFNPCKILVYWFIWAWLIYAWLNAIS